MFVGPVDFNGRVHQMLTSPHQLGVFVALQVAFTIKDQFVSVEHILPQAGNEDDITLRVNLETAQELLNRPGKVSAVLALMCECADGDPDLVLGEIKNHIRGIQVVDFSVRARARQNARSAIAKGTEEELEDIKVYYSLEKPGTGPFIRGRIQKRRSQDNSVIYDVRYGIEAYFAPKKKALALEKDLRSGGVAIVMIAGNGKATLKEVIANGS